MLHLGGQGTITAYAVQDNELWLRDLLGLLVQLAVALYIFLLSWKANWLSFLSIPMLLVGFIKYAERAWAMRSTNYAPHLTRPERHDSHENHDELVETYLAFGFEYMKRSLVFGDHNNHIREQICCADSTLGLKSITVNKRKLNNKHTQRTQEFTRFGKLPTSTETTEKFHYKNVEIQ